MEADETMAALIVLAGQMIQINQDLHQVYGSTSVCYGGIGGQAMTAHCGVVCPNYHAHAEQNSRWEQVQRAYYQLVTGDPQWVASIPT